MDATLFAPVSIKDIFFYACPSSSDYLCISHFSPYDRNLFQLGRSASSPEICFESVKTYWLIFKCTMYAISRGNLIISFSTWARWSNNTYRRIQLSGPAHKRRTICVLAPWLSAHLHVPLISPCSFSVDPEVWRMRADLDHWSVHWICHSVGLYCALRWVTFTYMETTSRI